MMSLDRQSEMLTLLGNSLSNLQDQARTASVSAAQDAASLHRVVGQHFGGLAQSSHEQHDLIRQLLLKVNDLQAQLETYAKPALASHDVFDEISSMPPVEANDVKDAEEAFYESVTRLCRYASVEGKILNASEAQSIIEDVDTILGVVGHRNSSHSSVGEVQRKRKRDEITEYEAQTCEKAVRHEEVLKRLKGILYTSSTIAINISEETTDSLNDPVPQQQQKTGLCEAAAEQWAPEKSVPLRGTSSDWLDMDWEAWSNGYDDTGLQAYPTRDAGRNPPSATRNAEVNVHPSSSRPSSFIRRGSSPPVSASRVVHRPMSTFQHYALTRGSVSVYSRIIRYSRNARKRINGTEPSSSETEEAFLGRVAFLPKFKASKTVLEVSFLQDLMRNSLQSLSSGLSFRNMVSPDSQLWSVFANDNLHGLRSMIREGNASLTDCDLEGRSLLNVSSSNVLKLSGADGSKYAVHYRCPEICRFVIEHGADVDSVEKSIWGGGTYVVLVHKPACDHLFL